MNDTTSAVEHLQAVGFSEYEARAYTTLVQGGPMTGYQLAKASGIPRPNVYPVIDRLEKRGAVTSVDVGGGVKYAALPAADMLARVSKTVESHLAGAGSALRDLVNAPASEYAWNVEGYENVLAHAERSIDGARERVLLGLWSNESARLGAALDRAQSRGVEVVVLCVQGCADECGSCRGDVYRYAVSGESTTRWLMLVADEREALIGQVSVNGDARAVETKLEAVVLMTAQYLRTTIGVAEIIRSLGSRLPKLLDRDALNAVQGTVLAVAGESWLKRLSSAVRRSRA
jgi:DNA-binding IscR family transcriptional regulator